MGVKGEVIAEALCDCLYTTDSTMEELRVCREAWLRSGSSSDRSQES